ncbi:transmembrane protein 130 [Synchiropus splendidus]|uniref:transmembrane protein 130 n=1 Tax=Synchiropus splendidus TaxID=270530 RepID=UPI00237D7210|nr:transmembrane protein 130 [Synchiropus splendidus]
MESTWVLMLVLVAQLGLTRSAGSMKELENIAGKLVFYQMEGNETYIRNAGELASDVPTETMFELSDPQRNLSSAEFTYTWDLGNGEVIQGKDPVVRYLYQRSGNYTLQLKVGANITTSSPALTGVYSMDIKVLDAVKHIKLKEQSDYAVSQNIGFSVYVDGSPPMWVCWKFLHECVPDPTSTCTLSMLYENILHLNHTFSSAGVHCLDISVSNDVSKMQTSFSLSVKGNSTPHVLFIVSSAAVLVATFSFIAVIACRPRHNSRQQIAVSSNALFLKSQECAHSRVLLNISPERKEENKPLLLPYSTHYS